MAVLTLEHVSYIYGEGTPFEIRALDDVSLSVREGTVTGIIGHTGSGKSTMVQLFNGLEKPTAGRVLLDGKDIWAEPKKMRDIRFRVGLVMQYPEYQLFEETIRADIAFGPRNMGLTEEEISRRTKEAAAFVGLEEALLDRSPFELSGGQKRRAAIAGIMAMRPEILVLDEPAAGLDPRGRDAILEGIRAYGKETGSTVIIVSHSMEDMAAYCDDIVVMAQAKVCLSGTRDEVFANAKRLTDVGLDVPQITHLMMKLRARGVAVPEGIYTVEAASAALRKLFGKGHTV
ncbi:MAG: energy-coupling factor transporter ATPase [Clostridia bacterium]|nr:energy-coupling factor transporter ATPase [Clostridia bacterium]MBR2463851.1 energy-coupling factor transporter ATPase [Clostridia bacterium]